MDPVANLVESEPDAPGDVVATVARIHHQNRELQRWLSIALDTGHNGGVSVAPQATEDADVWEGKTGEWIRSVDDHYYAIAIESNADTGVLHDEDREQFVALMDAIGAEVDNQREGRAWLQVDDVDEAIETLARYATLRSVTDRSRERGTGVAPAVDQLATEIVPQAVWARRRGVGRQAINKHVR